MRLIYAQEYNEMYKELTRNEQGMVDSVIELFIEDPFSPTLLNHKLTRNMTWKSAISVTEDIRIVFSERWDYFEVTMLKVGPHSKVYT